MTLPRPAAWVALVVGAGLALMLSAAPASAHAVLESTTPADDEAVPTAPESVVLRFNEPVSAPAGGVQVFDETGSRVDRAELAPSPPDELHVPLQSAVSAGTYVVTWRAVSADGHPIRGAFLFFVGEPGEVDQSLVAQLFDSASDRPVAVAATVVRAIMYGGLLVAVGLLVFVLAVPGIAPEEHRRLSAWSRRAAIVSLVATAAGVFLQTAQVTGLGADSLLDPSLQADTLASNFGVSSLVRLVGLAALAATVGSRSRVAAGSAAVALGSLLLSGHSVTTGPRLLVLASDATHLAVTSVWLGGLAGLALVMSRRRFDEAPAAAARIVARFSRLATWAVLGVVASGAAWAWAEVRAVRALTSTAYGWTLVAKVVLVGVVLAVGAYNNRRLVPAVARTAGAGVPVPAGGSVDVLPRTDRSQRAWRLLRRTVRIEIVGLMAVLLVTAGLVYLRPAAEQAGITGAFSTYAAVGEDAEVNLVVDPNRAGLNEIHVYLLDNTGRPASFAEALTLRLSLPAKDVGPIVREPQVAGPGHWVLTGRELSIAGRWEITLTARVSEFEQLEATIPVTVNP